MKYLLFACFCLLLSLRSFSQDVPTKNIEETDIELPANNNGWYSTGIFVKRNDLVFLNVHGIISIGPFAGEVNGTGNRDNPFLVAYSWFKDIPHATLICSNDDKIVFAQYKQELQKDNALFGCISQLSSSSDNNPIGAFFTDEYIGNFFQPKSDHEELKLLINDAKYSDNYGNFDVSIIIYHNFFPQIGDVIIYWGGADWIMHSGYVTGIDPDKTWVVTEISSFFIKDRNGGTQNRPYNFDPDNINLTDPKMFGNDWTIYHTDRPNGRLIDDRGISGFSAGYTDEGTTIWFSFGVSKNCHAYTFIDPGLFSINHYISGYRCIGGELHDDMKDQDDQGMAVEHILAENGYHQVHAQGINSKHDHFKKEYDIQSFHLRK